MLQSFMIWPLIITDQNPPIPCPLHSSCTWPPRFSNSPDMLLSQAFAEVRSPSWNALGIQCHLSEVVFHLLLKKGATMSFALLYLLPSICYLTIYEGCPEKSSRKCLFDTTGLETFRTVLMLYFLSIKI